MHPETPRTMRRVLPVMLVGALLMGGAALTEHRRMASSQPIPAAAAADLEGPPVLTLRGFGAPYEGEVGIDDQAVQFTRVDLVAGERTATDNEHDSRAALSIAKLYIAQYVFTHGTTAEKALARAMITVSDDWAAGQLYQLYPGSIDAIAEEYELVSTYGGGDWGFSGTSSYDVAYFLAQILVADPQAPLLEAMRDAEAVAADGTAQDFGTAVLSGVEGTKWGWSDDGTLHASVSFGEDFVVATFARGSADDLTTVVRQHNRK